MKLRPFVPKTWVQGRRPDAGLTVVGHGLTAFPVQRTEERDSIGADDELYASAEWS